MKSFSYTHYNCAIGRIRLRASKDALIAVDHVNQQHVLEETWQLDDRHPILSIAIEELDAYFERKLTQFNTPLSPSGTEFQQKVWKQLTQIPYGETASYLDVATEIANPKAVRAVGLANGKNPISIFIPCHRVIGKNGKLTGYAGGLSAKKVLLDIEIPSLF